MPALIWSSYPPARDLGGFQEAGKDSFHGSWASWATGLTVRMCGACGPHVWDPGGAQASAGLCHGAHGSVHYMIWQSQGLKSLRNSAN